MGVPVKTKKRKINDAYAGGERSGKKAKSDARDDPSTSDDPAPATQAPSAQSPSFNAEGSYYRARPNVPAASEHPASSVPPGAPIVKTAPSRKLVTASFDVDTFDLNDDEALDNLNNPQLRSLCEKYAVETARANADMVLRLRAYLVKSHATQAQRLPTYPAVYTTYPGYPYYYNYTPVPLQNPPK
ncbi:hypothetical protein B0H11DRAFT_2291322 [Mycena galericulata]|nr:hypothetical protein B0H11DRAFT_2291322 [Mycena galericulata]